MIQNLVLSHKNEVKCIHTCKQIEFTCGRKQCYQKRFHILHRDEGMVVTVVHVFMFCLVYLRHLSGQGRRLSPPGGRPLRHDHPVQPT